MRNALEKALDKVTGIQYEYLVFVQDVQDSARRLVGVWDTQAQAKAHTARMWRSGKYYSVEWSIK